MLIIIFLIILFQFYFFYAKIVERNEYLNSKKLNIHPIISNNDNNRQWLTILYYTQSNCQGDVIQFTTQIDTIGLQNGCNNYNPTIISDMKSMYINYSIDYPGLPINLLTQGRDYATAK